ncbi:MAG: tetratricopeptide repeat protein [Nitrosomonadales bacterium]|nr:tetratricopeptide repeat protein [Nitrosomonadales bacterium]
MEIHTIARSVAKISLQMLSCFFISFGLSFHACADDSSGGNLINEKNFGDSLIGKWDETATCGWGEGHFSFNITNITNGELSITGKVGNCSFDKGRIDGNRIIITCSNWLNKINYKGQILTESEMDGTFTQRLSSERCHWSARKQTSGAGQVANQTTPVGGGLAAEEASPALSPLSLAVKKSKRTSADDSLSLLKAQAGTAPASYSAVRHLPPSPGSGLYSLDAQVGFDTLDGVTFNPAQGTLSLFGHRTRSDGGADVRYLDLLAAALDSDKPVFSLEWTDSSQREVDRALAYFADDRNNEEITTRLSKIFDANGRVNRQGASFFKALGVEVREGMNRYEFNSSLLTASGHKNAGAALRAFGAMVETIKRGEKATKNLEDLANALDLYDFIAGKAAEYRNGQITQTELMDTVMPRLLTGLANAFGWNDRPYVDKYWRLRRSGKSFEDAGDEAMLDLQNDLNTLPRKALDTITAKLGEIVVPPDVMREVLGAEPRVRPVLVGLPDHTRLALTALEADVFSKSLFDMPGLQAKVPRYQGYFAWLRDRGQHPAAGEGHLWISPGNFELLESADRQTLRFGSTPMKFHIEKYESGRRSVANPQLSAYADLLTTCYDDIAREYPVLHRLRESTKMVAVAQWLKRRGYAVSMPRVGREVVNLPVELPGVIYMVMAVKQGSVGQILTAAGGVDFSGDNGWRYTPRDIQSSQTDLVDRTARQVREKVEQIFRRKIEAPMPRPMAEVKSEESGGQKVTTVTVAVGAGTEGAAPAVQMQRSPEDEAVRLWKAEDLAGAEQAYRKLIEAAAGDVRYAASLRALLAQVLHEKGDDAGAIKELNEAVRLAPDLPILQLLYAQTMVQSGDLPGAEAALRKYLALDPDNQAAARLLSDVQARQKGGAGAPAAALAAFPTALEGVPALDGSLETIKAKSGLTDISVKPPTITGRGPVLPDYVRNDPTIVDLQKKQDDYLAVRQKKDAEVEKLHRDFDATTDEVKKSELAAQAAQIKAESSQAELQAAMMNNEIQKRAKLLIDTHMEETPPAPGDQETPPPDAPKTGQ